MKLGKQPATHDPRDLKFAAYRTGAPLPPHPATFGHDGLIPAASWGMLGNDRVGCCVFSGFAHLVMLWNKIRGVDVEFSEESVLSDYAALTGWVDGDPSTDQGTNVRDALKYFRTTGVVDAKGDRHKIAGFAALRPGDLEEAEEAAFIFAGIAPGFNLPQSAERQFNAGRPWSVVRGSPSLGGHFVPVTSRGPGGKLGGITWGRRQPITTGFYVAKCDEAFAVFSQEDLDRLGKSPEGYDIAQLQADLQAVGS